MYEMERIRILKEGSAERLAIHFLQTPIGIIEWNLAFQVIEWNPAAERILGYTLREVIGQHASVFFQPQDYIVVETSWKTVIGTVLPERSTTRSVTKQGDEIWCLWYSAPLRDTGGRVTGVLSMFEDVTTKRRVENSLHIYANAIRTAINPIVMFESGGRLTYVNNAFIELWGYKSYKELVGSDISGFIQSAEGKDNFLVPLARDGRWAGELLGIRRDGGKIDVQVSANLTKSREGFPLCMMASCIDITDRKRSENERRRLNEELERRVIERTADLNVAYRELESFSYSVSHDLRAPLRRIDGFAALLEQEVVPLLNAQSLDYFKRIRNSVRRMDALIEDLINLSRITRTDVKFSEIDLGELANAVAEDLTIIEPQRRVHLTLPRQLMVKADLGLMRIVLENLLGNAWKFTASCQVARIEMGVTDIDGQRVFFVRDNGVGFDPRYADKLFGAFQRLHSPEEFQGSGIGLAIVMRIIQRHKGRIWAQGAIGQGAAFYFSV